MSLSDKLAKLSQSHQKILAAYEKDYNSNQTRFVLAEFEYASKQLGKRTKPVAGNSADIKNALDSLQSTYDNGNDIVRASLSETLEKLKKDYQACLKSEKNASVPLEVVLLWNSNNGDKELMLPVVWDSKNSPKDNIAVKIYAAAQQAISDYDSSCVDQEWHGFTKIVSPNIAGNKAEGLPAKNDIIQMQTDAIHEYIMSMIGPELQEYGITLNIINSKIKAIDSKEYAKSQKAPEQTPRKRISAGIDINHCIDNVVAFCKLKDIDDAAAYIRLQRNAILRKIKGKQLHGLESGARGKYSVPLHDLITYEFNFPKANPADIDADPKSNKHSSVMHELTEDEFSQYKSKVGEVCDAQKTSEMIGIKRNAVYARLNSGTMHGVRFDGQWYIPAAEIELCKCLYQADAAKETE